MIRILFVALIGVLAFSPMAMAKGLDVGAKIPAIATVDQNGKQQGFDSLKGSKGITIAFIRSVEWCPFCQRQVMDLSANAKKFKDAGYPVITISYDTPEKLKLFATREKIDLPMLSDARSDIIKAFGIFNENYAKGTMAYGTPYPGVYVVGADKTIKAKFFKDGVQDRPTVDELLASMKEPAPIDPAVEFPQEQPTSAAPSYIDGAPPAEPAPMPTEAELMAAPAPVETPAEPSPIVETPAADAVVIPDTATPPAAPAPVMDGAAVEAPAPVMEDTQSVAPSEPAVEFVPPAEEEGAAAPSGEEDTLEGAPPAGL
jgi:peroxiredoxin